MSVPRIGRVLDLVAAALIVVGGILYGHSYLGLEALRAKPLMQYRAGMPISLLAEFHSLERFSFVGLGAAILGIAVAVSAAIVARRRMS